MEIKNSLKKFRCHSIFLILFSSQIVFAGPALNEIYDNYFLISENSASRENSLSPLGELRIQAVKISASINLLGWTHYYSQLTPPPEKYDRTNQFGTWIHDSREPGCFNTRAKVLVRESKVNPELTPNGCQVVKGEWEDKSVNKSFSSAQFMKIDHFVPIKNAYISGAWRWSPKIKCMYTNFMGNSIHIIPFNRPENRKKSDKTPEQYMPPEKSYRCEYLHKWLVIKLIWKLALNPNEARAISKYLQDEACDLKQFQISEDYILQQRNWMSDNIEMCNRAEAA